MGRVPSLLLLGGANGHHMYGLAVAPDDLHFATICEDRCVRLWALHPNTSPEKTYYELALPTIPSVKLRSVAFSPCGKLLAVTSSDNRVLIFTTPSDSLSLSTQCTRVIRRCITRRLMEVYPTQTAALDARGSKFSISGLPNRLFCKAASYLPLPPHLILNLFREFGSHSQPYFHANMPSLV
ncbi:unnamed protein product [Dicrocoelium dendriticum]|nr:unnamed protein product [Dicrocoelium dendriticum]